MTWLYFSLLQLCLDSSRYPGHCFLHQPCQGHQTSQPEGLYHPIGAPADLWHILCLHHASFLGKPQECYGASCYRWDSILVRSNFLSMSELKNYACMPSARTNVYKFSFFKRTLRINGRPNINFINFHFLSTHIYVLSFLDILDFCYIIVLLFIIAIVISSPPPQHLK